MESKVKKAELLKILKENAEQHRGFFLKAVEGYRIESERILQERIDLIKAGDLKDIYIRMDVPADHTEDYKRAIQMVEMDVRDELTLDEQEFAQFVMDDWDWKRQWVDMNTAYMTAVA